MRSLMAAMTSTACSSEMCSQPLSCSGDSTRTSWIPPAVAWVNTGPRFSTTKGWSPSKAG